MRTFVLQNMAAGAIREKPPELETVSQEDWNALSPEARKAICDFVELTRKQEGR